MRARSRPLLAGLVISSFMAAGMARAAAVPSRPQRAILYRDGTAVLIEELGPDKAKAEIELPAVADLSSIRVRAGSRPVGGLDVETLYEESQTVDRTVVGGVPVEKTVASKQLVGHRLRIDPASIPDKGPLVLRYAVSGLSWRPEVSAELIDQRQVGISLTAVVTNQAMDLTGCKLQLASSAGQLPSKLDFSESRAFGDQTARAADLIYEAGTHTIAKGRTALLTVMTATGHYERTYVWHTDTRERVRVMVSFPNPLPRPLCPAPAQVYEDGVLLAQDAVEWARPGSRVELAAGHTHELELERSVDTTENAARKPRPFRHSIAFKVTNRGRRTINLAVVFPKKIGSRHKTLYEFKRKPDRRPGALLIWELELKPGQAEEIAFHLDSEYPRFGDYDAYEKARFSF